MPRCKLSSDIDLEPVFECIQLCPLLYATFVTTSCSSLCYSCFQFALQFQYLKHTFTTWPSQDMTCKRQFSLFEHFYTDTFHLPLFVLKTSLFEVPPVQRFTFLFLSRFTFLTFLQRVHIARDAERCNSQRDSVCPSVRHVPVLCPDEWRYDRAVYCSFYYDNPSSFWRGKGYPHIRRGSSPARALKWGTPISIAKIWQILVHNLETVQDRLGGKLLLITQGLSIGTKVGDLEWRWTTYRPCTLWGKKTAPFYFCNSFVRTSSFMTMFGTRIHQ